MCRVVDCGVLETEEGRRGQDSGSAVTINKEREFILYTRQGHSDREGNTHSGSFVKCSVLVASNDELYSKMRDQRIEREELRSKKKELEAIMKKDQNRRQYIRNQDNQSDNVSYTTGTDAFG